jgi:hypothetical protein
MLFLLAAIVACATAASSAAGEAQKVRRIVGSDVGGFTIVSVDAAGIATTVDTATGHAAGIGEYTLNASERVNLGTLQVTDGVYTIVTKHGTISGTYSGQGAIVNAATGDFTYDVTGPITGGTGKFAGASGTLRFLGSANFAGTLSDRIVGELVLPREADEDD